MTNANERIKPRTPSKPSGFQCFKDNERELKRKIIIDGARKLLKNKPYHAIAMKEIGEKVGIAPSSIYSYFKSQDELFFEVFKIDLAHITSLLKNNTEKSRPNAGSVALENISKAVDYILRKESALQMIGFMVSGKNLSREISFKIKSIQNDICDILSKTMPLIGIQNVNPDASNAFLTAVVSTVILFRKIMPANALSAQTIVRTIVDVFKTESASHDVQSGESVVHATTDA